MVNWSSSSSSEYNSTKLVLEDNGNLVLKLISDPNIILWQSFDHPTDTWLPGAKVGFNKLTSTQQVYESGCVNTSPFQCHDGEKEGFLLVQDVALPWVDGYFSGSQDMCKLNCMRNCNCEAYVGGGYSNCQNWYSLLGGYYSTGILSNVYVRLDTTNNRKAKPRSNASAIGAALGGLSLIITVAVIIWKSRRRAVIYASQAVEGSLILMKYSDLRRATKNFSCELGEGGFGFVYKGTLPNSSRDIAVKHLKIQGQGEKQFRAEISTLGTIHHSNLVRLLGFCIEASKRFLVYEYMPNGSLDRHIFCDSRGNLDWTTRYKIGLGIARGLAYLHSGCRECIIHCDIKPENILLDDEYNPKIADFGLAKLLCRDFSRVLTTMRGTRGYLAPEWISGAPITSKADVYSYGMMLFEIISGRRNWSVRTNGENDYFPIQVMQKLMSNEDVISLIDSKLEETVNAEELIRACRVAGWCIQENEEDRLSMINVVRILEGVVEVATPPIPRFLQHVTEIPEDSTAYHTCIVE